MNKNQINEINNLKNKKEEEIKPKEQKDNNSKLGEKENKKMNNDLKVNIYDEMPIKSSGYNFEELLEKTLANEENTQKEDEKNMISNSKLFNKKLSKSNLIEKNVNYNNVSEPNVLKQNQYFKIENEHEHQSFDKNCENGLNFNKIESFNINNKNNDNRKNILRINIDMGNKIDVNSYEPKQKSEELINILEIENKENKENNILVKSTEEKKNIQKNLNFDKIELLPSKESNIINDKNNNNDSNILINNDNSNSNKKEIQEKNKDLEQKNSPDKGENSILDKEKIIEQKIKELNNEIFRFKEEKSKIYKLKGEYEKIQTKLMSDVQQFNTRKEEFEKYKNEELKKIKEEKKKIIAENRNINNIKFQNQSYSMIIKKNKEIIDNLKKQISDYQFLIKKFEDERRNKKSTKKINNCGNKKAEELNLEYFRQNKKEKKDKEKRNLSSGNRKTIKNYRNFDSNLFPQTENMNQNVEENEKILAENEIKDPIELNNVEEINFNNININDLIKENPMNDEYCNYNFNKFKILNNDIINQSNMDNNVHSQINSNLNEFNRNTDDNEMLDIHMNYTKDSTNDEFMKKHDIKSERALKPNSNNNLNKSSNGRNNKNTKKEKININVKKELRKSNYNLYENNINNKSKNKTTENWTKKRIYKNNTISRLNRGSKELNTQKNNLLSKTNLKLNNTINNNTINKSFKSSKPKTQINISKKEQKNYKTEKNNIEIPIKYRIKEYKLLNSLTSDGKIINIYSNNKKEIIFQSGVRKEIYEDGYQIVHFMNGDIKQNYPDGKVIYFFNETQTTQTSYNNGLQVFQFNNGQIEKHYPDGSKQISFPDGSKRFILSDGTEDTCQDDNSQKINGHLDNDNLNNKKVPGENSEFNYEESIKSEKFHDNVYYDLEVEIPRKERINISKNEEEMKNNEINCKIKNIKMNNDNKENKQENI